MKKIAKSLAAISIVAASVANVATINAAVVNVDGVEQGVDDITYAKNAPLADIVIINSVIANFENARASVSGTYPGFTIIDNDELNNRTFTTDLQSSTPNENDRMLVYDESVPGARKVTGNVGSMNTFEGEIATFTYDNAALLPDGSRGDVIITYSDISLPVQNNFGKRAGVSLSRFYSCDMTYSIKLHASLKEGYECSDFWEYDEENDRGVYKQPGLYTIGYGYWMKIYHNILADRRSGTESGYTTRYGLKMDIKIQVLDKSGNPVNGTFMFPITDIDVPRSGSHYSQIEGAADNHNYSETIRVNSGVDKDSKIYIPGDIEGDAARQYKTIVERDDEGIIFVGNAGDPDPGTTYSGFVTIVDNKSGLNLTYTAGGSQGYGINTFVLRGNEFHSIISSSGLGGTIQTTKTGNKNGDLTDGSDIFGPGSVDLADGKTVKYAMTPQKGYKASLIKVDGKDVDLPGDGEITTVELDGPDNAKMIGQLINLGNGKYIFVFPDNNYNHTIHVEWEKDGANVLVPDAGAVTANSMSSACYLTTTTAVIIIAASVARLQNNKKISQKKK